MGCSSFIKNFLNCTILASPRTLLGLGRRVRLDKEGEGHIKFSESPKGILMLTSDQSRLQHLQSNFTFIILLMIWPMLKGQSLAGVEIIFTRLILRKKNMTSR